MTDPDFLWGWDKMATYAAGTGKGMFGRKGVSDAGFEWKTPDTLNGNGGGLRPSLPGVGAMADIDGTDIGETLEGTTGYDKINGKGGNDIIRGMGSPAGNNGEDVLHGNDGDDQIYAGAGTASLYGDAGDDYLEGGGTAGSYIQAMDGSDGNDTILGGRGNYSFMYGGAGNDTITGRSGIYDELYGGDGNDILTVNGPGIGFFYGQGGADVMTGGAGGDWFYFFDGDTIDGKGGHDTVNILTQGATIGLNIDFTTYTPGSTLIVGTGSITNVEVINFGDSLTEFDDRIIYGAGYSSFVPLNGGGGNDYLVGGSSSDTLDGSDGNDEIHGLGGGDMIGGGVGDDRLYGEGGADQISGGGGNDQIFGGAGDDTLTGNLGNDHIDGGDGIDRVTFFVQDGTGITVNLTEGFVQGGAEVGRDTIVNVEIVGLTASNDVFIGDANANTVIGAGQNDQLYGMGGDDTYYLTSDNPVIFESAGGGIDQVFTDQSHYLFANVENLTMNQGALPLYAVGNELDNVLKGNSGDNLMIAGAGADTVWGGYGKDALFGQDGADTLNGEGGIDYIVGGAGDDIVDGGTEADALYGEDGDDTLDGGLGFFTDILTGGAGDDLLIGYSGLGELDHMDGGAGDDIYLVDTPFDYTYEAAGGGEDTVIAEIDGAGYYLYANVENLILLGDTPFGVGNELDNVLIGSEASNWLLGGAGADVLNGQEGNDVLFGEGGSDTFVFEQGTGGDVIGDFVAGTDRIDLSAFGFASFAQVQANMVQNGGNTAINLGGGDFIVLNGVLNATLHAADFILASLKIASDEVVDFAAQASGPGAEPGHSALFAGEVLL